MENNANENVAQRYVDILTNAGFKALFGDEANKDVVMSVINEFLPEHRQVTTIEYLPTEQQGPVISVSKEYHYDFMCRDRSGSVFIVEMQCYSELGWFQRCVSYASRAYDRQVRRGDGYDIAPVYLIGLMGVPIEHHNAEYWRNRYISEYTFREKSCGELLAETIFIIFAELAGFDKRREECQTEQDRMLYLLKNVGRLNERPQWLQNEVYERFFRACEICAFNKDKRIEYEKDMNDERRLNGMLRASREEGLEEGQVQGKAELLLKMYSKGMSEDDISSLLDMPLEMVKKLLASDV
ncbi:MAG: Rpn family recombination-promoting nuclease/putative transposase [Bacteroidales bacterium]|nr:Rpn family recombination-promoting nuclease/putative transposase [Bacteroidales bacterium]